MPSPSTPTPTPASQTSRAAHPARLYRTLATAEMVTWTLLLAGMAGKYLLDLGDLGVRVGGSLHGLVFLSYCLVTVLIAVDRPWRLRSLVVGVGSAVLPYATVPFERHAERAGLLGSVWRLRTQAPDGLIERVVAAVIRRPVTGAVIALVAVGLVFAGLLALGPPWQWFS